MASIVESPEHTSDSESLGYTTSAAACESSECVLESRLNKTLANEPHSHDEAIVLAASISYLHSTPLPIGFLGRLMCAMRSSWDYVTVPHSGIYLRNGVVVVHLPLSSNGWFRYRHDTCYSCNDPCTSGVAVWSDGSTTPQRVVLPRLPEEWMPLSPDCGKCVEEFERFEWSVSINLHLHAKLDERACMFQLTSTGFTFCGTAKSLDVTQRSVNKMY